MRSREGARNKDYQLPEGLRRANRCFQFQKRSQNFFSAHNETLSVALLRTNNPDCSPILGLEPRPSPNSKRISRIVSDELLDFRRSNSRLVAERLARMASR
jgi:hypothetical protein